MNEHVILFRVKGGGLAFLLDERDDRQDDGIWVFPSREDAQRCVDARPGLMRLPIQIVKLEI